MNTKTKIAFKLNYYYSILWIAVTGLSKYQLSQLAERTGLSIHVSHFPPGTSKWNKVEHRLFCYITKNWQGQPLVDIQTAVNLIGTTTTAKGLKVICKADYNEYPLSKKVSDEDCKRNPR